MATLELARLLLQAVLTEDIRIFIYIQTRIYAMPKCPECGDSENSIGKWFQEESNVHAGEVLIVCPSCDTVLGGGAWGSGA